MVSLRTALAFVMCFFFADQCGLLPARAQSAEQIIAAKELSDLVSMDLLNESADVALSQSWPTLQLAITAAHPKVDAKTLADLREIFKGVLMAQIVDLRQELTLLYARRFSPAELREITAFYRTPTGAKALREGNKIGAEVGAQFAGRVQGAIPNAMVRMQNLLRERGL